MCPGRDRVLTVTAISLVKFHLYVKTTSERRRSSRNGCSISATFQTPTPSSAYPASTTDDSGLIRPVHRENVNDGDEAPFRLLVLADPQLEGDSSLPDPDNGFLPRLGRHWQEVSEYNLSYADRRSAVISALNEVILRDIPDTLRAVRKRVDLFGNDYYLAQIYRTLHWWTQPTHVTVLGDLIGSQ